MGLSRSDIRSIKKAVRWKQINAITSQHTPFPEGRFGPELLTVWEFAWPRLPQRQEVHLVPVAFWLVYAVRANEKAGDIWFESDMIPYMWLDPDSRLVRKISRRYLSRPTLAYVANPFDVTDEDLQCMKLVVQGDESLFEAERERSEDRIMTKIKGEIRRKAGLIF